MFGQPSDKSSHANLMTSYEKSLGSTWPFFADPDWKLEPYFASQGLPLVMLVTTADMRIVHASVGHHSKMLKEKADEVLGK
jgi:hypothetical protein